MPQIPGFVWVIVGIGLAIATPWMIFVALDREGRSKSGQAWRASMEALNKTLHSETPEIDELSRRVEKLKENNPESKL